MANQKRNAIVETSDADAADGMSLTSPVRALAALLLEPGGRYARAFETLILVLIMVSVATVGLEAIPGLPVWARHAFYWCEVVVVAVFSFEYLLRIAASKEKLKFIFSFHGLIDLVAIAPFYVGGFDTQWLRALRLLRVLKLQTHVLEYNVATRTQEIADKHAALEREQARIKAELDIARALQIAILPSVFPSKPACEAAAKMIPATTMAGDFYDYIELPGGQIGLVMADVSGKGVPAAFFMAMARTILRDFAANHPAPGACLAETNRELCSQNPMDLFVTVFYCVLDPATGLLRYANGGHNPPYLRRNDGSVQALGGAGGLVLGAKPGVQFPDHVIQLQPGDQVVLYTDGVTEAFNSDHEPFGEQRLVAEIQAHEAGPAADLVERICHSVAAFAGGAPQSDDITLIVLSWKQG